MIVMDRKYGEKLKGISGQELMNELHEVIKTIGKTSDFDQSKRDRGCYLILENIVRVPEDEQEELIRGMLEANVNPSQGVRFQLRDGWRPKKMPSAKTLMVILGVIGVGLLDCLKDVSTSGMTQDLFGEIETILTAQDKYYEIVCLAEVYAQSHLPRLMDQMMARVIEICREEIKNDRSWAKNLRLNDRCAELFRNAVKLSIKHSARDALDRLLSSDESRYLDKSEFLKAAVIVGSKKWLEVAIERVIKEMHTQDVQSNHYSLAQKAFELVKDEEFASYRTKLFTAMYSGKIFPYKSLQYDASFLKILATMAVHFENKEWQDKVYLQAMNQMPKGSYGYIAYEAFMIMAPVHAKSQQTLDTTPRPAYVYVMK